MCGIINFLRSSLKFSKASFIRNIFWNFGGFSVSIFTALICIPIIISNIGVERFGILTLILAFVGFMNVFDFGLTRSITNSIVKYKDRKNKYMVLSVINSGVCMIIAISILIAIVSQIYMDKIVHSIFSVSDIFYHETTISLSIISISLPFVLLQTASVSILEAFGEFKTISLAKTPFSILMYVAPAGLSFLFPNLILITISICVIRIIMAISFFILQKKIINKYIGDANIGLRVFFNYNMMMELIKYGGWVSISNIVAPIMLYIDRFFVASIVGAGMVAYYTTPFEMISKMSVVSLSVSGVLFPVLAKNIKTDIALANTYYNKALLVIGLFLVFPVVFGSLFSREIISLWINIDFAKQSWIVFCIFLCGFLVHGLIQPAYIWIQASGKPHITALAHLFDFALYLIYFPFLTKLYGINGAAISWLTRVVVSMITLHLIRLYIYKRGLK